MNIQIGIGLRDSNDFDLTIDPIGKYVEPKSPWNIPCERNEAKIIKVNLNIIHLSALDNYISILLSKLRSNGKLVLHGSNLNEINRLYFMGSISDEQYNSIIYPEFDSIQTIGLYSPKMIKNKLEKYGLKINKISLDNTTYCIEAIRQ